MCLCGNEINGSMKVDDRLCSDNCAVSYVNYVCDHVTYYEVFWREHGIAGLMLRIEKRVKLFSKTLFHANALSQSYVEFRCEMKLNYRTKVILFTQLYWKLYFFQIVLLIKKQHDNLFVGATKIKS